ncbi:MAG: hypothetical protein M3280_12265, partial [Actinomycetota bacterium]|nr:hypothetical protein [Actinomycetota bacterium]
DYSFNEGESAPEAWLDYGGLGSAHVYDTATLDGQDLWMVGSRNYDAVVWRSLDGGTTWNQVLTIPPINPGEFSRFYFAGVYGGKLYVQASDSGAGSQPHSLVFDGSGWSSGPKLFTQPWGGHGHHPENFAGKLVYQTYQGGWADLIAFDGEQATIVLQPQIRDFTVANSKVYVLTMDDRILSSSNLTEWQEVAAAPRESSSLEILSSDVYVGTSTAELYRYTPTSDSKPGSARKSKCRSPRCTTSP